LTVSWKDLLNYQLFAVNSLTGRRVPLRRIARANNNFSIKLSSFKRTHRLLKGTYYLSAVSLTKSVFSQSFAIEDLPVNVTALVQGPLLTVTIANPEEIDPEPEPGVYATLFLVLSTGSTNMFSVLMYAIKQPSEIFPEVSTYTLSDLKFLDGTPLVNGTYIAQIYFGGNPAPDYGASDPFYYSVGTLTLGEVLQAGNTASADIDMDDHDLNNINNLMFVTTTGFTGEQGIYATTQHTFVIHNDGVNVEPEGEPATYKGDVYIDTGNGGKIILGGVTKSVELRSTLNMSTNPDDPININGIGINMSGNDIENTHWILSNVTDEMLIRNNNSGGIRIDTSGTDAGGFTAQPVVLGGSAKAVQVDSKLIMSIDPESSINSVENNNVGIDMGGHAIIGIGSPLTMNYTSLPNSTLHQVGYKLSLIMFPPTGIIPTSSDGTFKTMTYLTIPTAGLYYMFFTTELSVTPGTGVPLQLTDADEYIYDTANYLSNNPSLKSIVFAKDIDTRFYVKTKLTSPGTFSKSFAYAIRIG
jgi:hypothetical protein